MWPSPLASNSNQRALNDRSSFSTTLVDASMMWGTPVARDDQKSPDAHMAMKARMGGNRTEATSLTGQAKMWSTPRASMNENRTGKPAPSHGVSHGRTLAGDASLLSATTSTDGETGSPAADLNPRFVAALMGVPWSWLTPSTSAAMDWSRWLLLMRCAYLQSEQPMDNRGAA
jgi:hypothetical protein